MLHCCCCPRLQEPFTVQKKLHTLDRLAWSDMFETFLANK
jgi:2-oxoglutarate dehydrogenase complex dehydrogenase (E1) component-like enzyme